MTRKVILIVSDPRSLVVLCDDGTMWDQSGNGWRQIPGPVEQTVAAELVAELRARSKSFESEYDEAHGEEENWKAGHCNAFADAADLVAEKLGVGNGRCT